MFDRPICFCCLLGCRSSWRRSQFLSLITTWSCCIPPKAKPRRSRVGDTEGRPVLEYMGINNISSQSTPRGWDALRLYSSAKSVGEICRRSLSRTTAHNNSKTATTVYNVSFRPHLIIIKQETTKTTTTTPPPPAGGLCAHHKKGGNKSKGRQDRNRLARWSTTIGRFFHQRQHSF